MLLRVMVLLISMLSQVAVEAAIAEESLPIAPRRLDDRDVLPLDAFVSLSGKDPVVPGENVSPEKSQPRLPATSSGKSALKKQVAKGSKPAATVNKGKTALKSAKKAAPGNRKPASKKGSTLPKKKTK